MKTRQPAADGFYRHLREWFTAFLPRQRGAAQNTITSCRQTWNMLLVRIPIESVHPFRSNPYSGSGVFVHLAARL